MRVFKKRQTKVKSFFRSEDMDLCQLLLHTENAFDCLIEVGHHGAVQFNNVYDEDRLLNNLYSKKVTQCYELLRIVDSLHTYIVQLHVNEIFYPDVDRENRLKEKDLAKYSDSLKRIHVEASAVTEHYYRLDSRRNRMMEHSFALNKANKYMVSDMGSELLYSESTVIGLVQDATTTSGAYPAHLNYMIGCIRADKFYSFELLLYRLCSFNLIIRFSEMPSPVYEYHYGYKPERVRKFAILMMASSTMIWPKVLKICAHYHVNIYDCPSSASQREDKVKELSQEIVNVEKVLKEAELMRRQILEVAGRDLFIIRVNLRKALKVYDLMNRLRLVGGVEVPRYLLAEVYIPSSDVPEVEVILRNASRISGGADNIDSSDEDEMNDMKTMPNTTPYPIEADFQPLEDMSAGAILLKKNRLVNHMPPTYFRLNKFTRGFQNLIDAYGMADYKELNPAPYTIITFPFLFAVMFGDLGHGILLILFSSLMIWKHREIEKYQINATSENEILNILYAGRYIILLMGVFSVYMGLVYNIVMAKGFNLFGSSWSCRYNETTVYDPAFHVTLDSSHPHFYSGHPYPLGMDPVWAVCGQDSITTTNSLKMKMAIVLGISQMMFGLGLAAANCVLMNRKADLILVVIPQMIFMLCLFGYLVFLIFYKWMSYGGHKPAPYNAACAPSVLITFINMMLMKKEDPVENCLDYMYPNERMIEFALVGIAFCTIPILLAGKPIYLMRRRRKMQQERERDFKRMRRQTIAEMRSTMRYTDDDNSETSRQKSVDNEEEHEMSEIWIHSGIHTIETVLGSVSHTASYLRLWALSLAHDQLSDVLWHMVLTKGFANTLPLYYGVPVLMATFFAWAILTVAILVMMEGLSAFLHTLRLHWVEFQSKFFGGAGESFKAFNFPTSNQRS
uniref:V-type proton ATPase subunit a n=2 Tax=Drosophila melanogaster TaxID=7227 RepID=A1ZBF7_DROME|nr:vacuolar H[+] ATPase 100kD subunit 3 [Drosophila melanogaster]AAM68427.1 vacuolar H[+] ATPase 100kD subunit 3 [Drosophila melanogaster]|eukprot:NP_725837.1 vacuolar H[+] ATPase 100kD subunit 3 [Drosophila melanogaster]